MTSVFAPAKINLALHVTGRRNDGYHLLDSLVVFVDTGDLISVEPTPGGSDVLLRTGPYGGAVPDGPDNLVLRAAAALREACPAADRHGLRLTLDKQLPAASGIGGGSADAAATLLAAAQHFELPMAPDDPGLQSLALDLGADVPMCLLSRPLRVGGIGEELVPVDGMADLHLVLVNPGVEVPTPVVFAELEQPDHPPMRLPARLPGSMEALVNLLGDLRNDLEAPALRIAPSIGDALAALDGAGALLHRMSGSGATCFGLFASPDAATRAAEAIAAAHPGFYVKACRTLSKRPEFRVP